MKKEITLKVSPYFYSRAMNMKCMVAALLVCKVEHPSCTDKINSFLITSDFLSQRSFDEITYNLTNQLLKNDSIDALFKRTLIELDCKMNFFYEPRPFKDALQIEKNKILVAFCKKFFSYRTNPQINLKIYRKFCNF